MRNTLLILTCSIAFTVPPFGVLQAQNHEQALGKYLTDDVVAVAYLDLTQIDTNGVMEWAEKFGLVPSSEERGQATNTMLMVQSQLDKANDLGAHYIYSLFRVPDVSHSGPTWVVPVAKGGNAKAVMDMVLSGRPARFEIGRDVRLNFLPDHCEVVDGAVLGANSAEQLEEFRTSRPLAKRDLSDVWKSLGQGHCGLIVFGDQDSRRVVREMFPKLPVPFHALGGPFLADRLLWGGIVARLPPEPGLQVIVQTDQYSSAEILKASIDTGLTMLKQLPAAQQFLSNEDLDELATSLTPSVTDSQLNISFANVFNDLERIAKLVAPPMKAAQQAAYRNQRMNDFKRITLGMLNYESAKKSFPPRGTFSEDGKPLLSWRVHILPYLGQGNLYKQFHLDEPWDSEHNKKLIPRMPQVYADPDPALANRIAAGRTTYVVPTGPGTLFEKPEGTPIKEITDGTSNTIMLVEVWSMAGPIWTQPKDWVMDPSNPWERLQRRDERDGITAGFCDGHTQILPTSIPGKKLRAMVTIAGGEIIEWP